MRVALVLEVHPSVDGEVGTVAGAEKAMLEAVAASAKSAVVPPALRAPNETIPTAPSVEIVRKEPGDLLVGSVAERAPVTSLEGPSESDGEPGRRGWNAMYRRPPAASMPRTNPLGPESHDAI
ncbi:hypothetical protein RE2895_14090 [Rhodococcus erythropolis]|nr:hypothetical protein RE2895_14090 [Rhodococcus erythropolis]